MRWTKLDLTYICLKKLTHRCFRSSMSICSSWIDRVNFLYLWPSKMHVSPTGVVSSLFPPLCRLSSDRHHHAATSCHVSFPWSQDKLVASASFIFQRRFILSPPLSSRNRSIDESAPLPPATLSEPAPLPPSNAIKRSSQLWSLFPPLKRAAILPPP
jgi:hypothetical protein